jgi:O-antigen/teichoic acid export membrane protein
VFSAIFMPLTLIAGIYGMNFDNMPELNEPWAYFTVLGAMAAIAATLWVYFVRRGFIGGPKLRDLVAPAKAAGRVGRGLASAAMVPLRVTPGRREGTDGGSSPTPTSGSRR